jgi:hypothetical protein
MRLGEARQSLLDPIEAASRDKDHRAANGAASDHSPFLRRNPAIGRFDQHGAHPERFPGPRGSQAFSFQRQGGS